MRLPSALLGVVLATTSARADSLTDLMGPREIAVGEAMRGGATGASSIGMNPAGLPLNRELVFEGGYGYRVTDSASLIGVSACDSTNALPGCFFYSYAGGSPELDGGMSLESSAHVGGVSLSRAIVPRVSVGMTAKYFRYSSDMMMGEDVVEETRDKGFTFDVGGTVRLTEMINLGIAGQNLFGTSESEHFPRAIGGGLHARPTSTLALSFDSRWKTDGKGARYGGGGELFLRAGNNGIPIRLGGLHDTGLGATYITGGIGFASLKWGIDVGARRELAGGEGGARRSTVILASMRFYGPRLPAPAIDVQ